MPFAVLCRWYRGATKTRPGATRLLSIDVNISCVSIIGSNSNSGDEGLGGPIPPLVWGILGNIQELGLDDFLIDWLIDWLIGRVITEAQCMSSYYRERKLAEMHKNVHASTLKLKCEGDVSRIQTTSYDKRRYWKRVRVDRAPLTHPALL